MHESGPMGDAMRNRTCRGCGKNFIPRAKAKHCSRECRRKGYLGGWLCYLHVSSMFAVACCIAYWRERFYRTTFAAEFS